jgi:hypothetical protein
MIDGKLSTRMSIENIKERVKRKHMALAKLPIEEKIRILVRMQIRANAIRRSKGRRERPIWKLS